MISFNNLGKYGRLGNQLFQFASLKGIAINNGYDFCIPVNYSFDEYSHNKLIENFNIGSVKLQHTNNEQFNERFFHFDEELFNNCQDNIDLFGYFQSYKYFENIENEIRNDFKFIKNYTKPEYEYTCLHVRRGDHIGNEVHHPVLTKDYYIKAMQVVGKENKIVVVSDDINWCMQQDFLDGCEFFSGQDNVHDLYIMSQAKNNIIANSTFSWWGAWLNNNKNKIVVCPKTWFGAGYSHLNLSDLRPKEWIQI